MLLAGATAFFCGCAGLAISVVLILANWSTFGVSDGIATGPIMFGLLVPATGMIAVVGYVVYRLARLLPKRHPADWRGPRGFNIITR